MVHNRTRAGRCKKCRAFGCQVSHSLKPSKLRKAYEKINAAVESLSDGARADMFVNGGPR